MIFFTITNKSRIKRRFYLLLVLLVVILLAINAYAVFYGLKFEKWIFTIQAVILFGFLYSLIRMKFIIVESSGLVLTVKQYYFFDQKRNMPPILEFPISEKWSYQLKNNLLFVKLERENLAKKIRIALRGMGRKEKTELNINLLRLLNSK